MIPEESPKVVGLTLGVKDPYEAPRIRNWFIRRDAMVADVCDRLVVDSDEGDTVRESRMVGLAGPGGAGKSSVASMVIARDDVRTSFNLGVLWLTVGSRAKDRLPCLMFRLATAVYETVLSKTCRAPRRLSIGMDPEDGASYIKEVVGESSHRLLVVADDVRDVEVLSELEKAGVSVLYTTRQNRLVLPGTVLLRLDQILKEEAEVLLRRAADLVDNVPLPEAAYDLMTRCDFRVMHLAFVGRWGVVRGKNDERSWQTALSRIEDAEKLGGEGEAALDWHAAILRAGFEELALDNPQNKYLYLSLGLLPEALPFSSEVAAVLLYGNNDLSEESLKMAGHAASTLERWSILTREVGGSYRMHGDHSEFVNSISSSESQDTRKRVLPRWQGYISGAHALIGHSDDVLVQIWEVISRLEGIPVCHRMYDAALKAMGPSNAKLPSALAVAARFCWLREDWTEAYRKYSELLVIQQSTDKGDDAAMARTMYALGWCASESGRPEEAEELLRRALAIQEKRLPDTSRAGKESADAAIPIPDVGIALDAACSLQALGVYALDSGRRKEAAKLLGRALMIQKEKLGAHHPDVASTIRFLGECTQKGIMVEDCDDLDLDLGSDALEEDGSSEPDHVNNLSWWWLCCTQDDTEEVDVPPPPQGSFCVGDSAAMCGIAHNGAEREIPVFVPDACRNKYVVVGLAGAIVRTGAPITSPVIGTISEGTEVLVAEVMSRRAHITEPLNGWLSLAGESGYVIVEALPGPTLYKVIYPYGIFVRSAPSIDDGELVRIEPYGTIIKATGRTRIFEAVERVEVEGGWVSMNLREDDGLGTPLLMTL